MKESKTVAKTPKEIAEKILEDHMVGTMATIEGNKPHSRYMTFFNDHFTLYTVTSDTTHKVEELSKNPYTHILIGYDGKGFGDSFLEIEGKVEISSDDTMREKVWNKFLKPWFEGPDDPKMVILKVTPSQIRLMNSKGESPQMVDIN
ncbi:pyridoxamine 5'-phosphate oxidase family protein [Lysinibacillus sp. BW-2-10]|uniref:pyridoxamine 5'-phosphate oxidase family protein n=1 Tax=Lysinibacillus sp. BW-2-10 TaxID=2590030 RepID=UPI00117DC6DF|nr:pyridoxamine 5'-phosphate oxidase family protein [Lysinibacillus sp. BW-2-10]TSI03370.1 general stress protein [Lysinibacillus sp. BW-2-10]